MTRLMGFSLCLALVALVGCNKDDGSGGGDETSSAPAVPAPAESIATTSAGTTQTSTEPAAGGVKIDPERTKTPQQAVEVFLVALLSADQDTADAMLTEKAREENAEANQQIVPPGSPTARFQIGEFEYITETPDEDPPMGAHVMSTLTDEYDGETQSHDIVWILRNEPAGWRVAGMAMRLFEDQDPLILNFEDPEEAARLTAEAEAEMALRAEQQLR